MVGARECGWENRQSRENRQDFRNDWLSSSNYNVTNRLCGTGLDGNVAGFLKIATAMLISHLHRLLCLLLNVVLNCEGLKVLYNCDY